MSRPTLTFIAEANGAGKTTAEASKIFPSRSNVQITSYLTIPLTMAIA